MRVALVMFDPMVGTRRHRAGGAAYALGAYLKERSPRRQELVTRIFAFNSLHRGAVNIYATAVAEFAPDVVGVSVYCWNLQLVSEWVPALRRVLGRAMIVLGGPEVSFDASVKLGMLADADAVVRGEGEVTFSELVTRRMEGRSLEGLPGVTYRDATGGIVVNPERPLPLDLDELPSPYLSGVIDLEASDGEVAYESVRGCKYACSYCLYTKGVSTVRAYSLARVEADLGVILRSPVVTMLWFVDPTFNAEERRALAILEIIERLNPRVPLAFELRADLLTDRLIERLARLNVAEVALGLQTTSSDANHNVARTQQLDVIERNVRRLRAAAGAAEIDVDLIFGLPGDSHAGYKRSVDYVIDLGCRVFYQPLRVFRGTKLERDAAGFGLCHGAAPPYNVLCGESYPLGQMLASYCVNVGIDFYNRGGAHRVVLDELVRATGMLHSDLFEQLGRHFWDRGAYEAFRASNWTPDDRPSVEVTEGFADFATRVVAAGGLILSPSARLALEEMQRCRAPRVHVTASYFHHAI